MSSMSTVRFDESVRKVVDFHVGLDFWAQGEYAYDVLFLHCDVYKNTSATIRNIKKLLKEVQEESLKYGYNKPLFSYTQNPRFAKLMGGEYHAAFEIEGETYEVWKWQLER